MRGRIGACVAHSKYGPQHMTSAARRGFAQKFIDQVDPDRVLPEDERMRRADLAKRAYMAQLRRKRG